MTFDEEEIQQILRGAASRIPTGNAPVGDLIGGGQRARRRRRTVQVTGVSAIFALIVGGSFAALHPDLGSGRGGAGQPSATTTTDATVAPAVPTENPHSFDPSTAVTSFPYTLGTHCGIRFASFEGRTWVTHTLSDGSYNPPPGWGNPGQRGRIFVMAEDRAVFTSPGHRTLSFRPTNAVLPPCD